MTHPRPGLSPRRVVGGDYNDALGDVSDHTQLTARVFTIRSRPLLICIWRVERHGDDALFERTLEPPVHVVNLRTLAEHELHTPANNGPQSWHKM